MTVFVNGEACELATGTTVAGVVDAIGCGWKGVAVAVNEDLVPRSTWHATAVQPGDRVEVLTAKQGG